MGCGKNIKSSIILGFYAFVFLAVLSLVPGQTYADTSFSIVTPEDPILEISLSSNLAQLDLTPKPNTPAFNTTDFTVSIATNNVTGYSSYMSIDSTTLTRTEALANNTTPTIPSLATNANGYTESNFTTNSWGYRIGNGNFFAIPSTNLDLSSSSSITNGDSTTVTFASKVDMSQPAGTYNTGLSIVAVTNVLPPTMQDINTWRGSLITNQSVRARDERDGKYYWVTKLQTAADNPFARADNNGDKYQIWMTQNLDLDLDISKPLVSTTSDLNTTGGVLYTDGYTNSNGVISWTPVNSTTTDTSELGEDSTPYSYNPGTYWVYKNATNGSDECNGDDCMHWHVGNFYYGAAAVATNDINQRMGNYEVYNNSICPKNWRLPTGPHSASGYSDFNYLLVQHNIIADYVAPDENAEYVSAGYSNIQDAPLYIARAGYFYPFGTSPSMQDINRGGALWGNVAISDVGLDGNNLFFFNDSYVSPAERINEDLSPTSGLSIRCIAREPDSTITFNANGGTGTMNPQTLREGTGTLNSNTFTRANYNFNGWNTAADGSGTSYADGATYTGASTTLYAQWKMYIQNVTTATCPTERTLVYDSRDENPYYIQKNDYSFCWMTSNLNIAGGTTLTSAKSNVASSYTLPASSTAGFSNGTGTGAFVYNDSTYGGYYSWVAATAGTNPSSGDSTYDICPKGWHLPSEAIYDNLIISAEDTTGASLTAAPWYGAYGGVYSDSSVYRVGSEGNYWSSTARSGGVYSLRFNSSIARMITGYKYDGYSVRCIAQ